MWAVLEIQSNGGQMAILSHTYGNWDNALSAFYQTMVAVSQSNVPEHTALIMDNVGQVVKKETIYHNAGGEENE